MIMPMSQPRQINIADISDEMRDRALKRTAEMVRKLDEVRRGLELNEAHLPIVFEIYGKQVAALVAEAEREELAKRTLRLPMTIRSEDNVHEPLKLRPGQVAMLKQVTQWCAFRPEDVSIEGEKAHWKIHDIQIGGRSQFLNIVHEPVLGTHFGPNGVLAKLRLETVQTAMELALIVEYIGPDPEGAVFEATMVGTAVTF